MPLMVAAAVSDEMPADKMVTPGPKMSTQEP
ncbi:unannotated protein [freshwater metagenome]|uniref:Unannotated protein n=1 Tax=freshwater metagenome TaxID=449393 RepID=A0A6J6MQ65_9ZZZZ